MTASLDVLTGNLRVGDVAAQTGTTARTIRYYEEIGLLTPDGDRPKGVHRLYGAEDVERIREVMRLRDLLGLSLEQLSTLVEVESVRRHLKHEWAGATRVVDRRRILTEALQCADTQLELVQRRKVQLAQLEDEIRTRKHAIETRLRGLTKRPAAGTRAR
jgi:DNA-binding transcriptional MerR regulator